MRFSASPGMAIICSLVLCFPAFAAQVEPARVCTAEANAASGDQPPAVNVTQASSNPTGATSTSPKTTVVDAAGTPSQTFKEGSVSSADLPLDQKKKTGFVRGIVKGLGKELGSSLEYMAKDSAFVFSAQDYDANKTSAPSKKPYEDYHIRWSDGTRSSIIKYPDGKQVIATGHRAGTVMVPLNQSTFDIVYPSGKHGTLSRDDDGGFELKRYDGAVIKLSPKMDGGYYISNADGEMGTIEPSVVDTHYGFYSKHDSMEF